MPIYSYKAAVKEKGCDYCRDGFELLQKVSEESLKKCPKCGKPVIKVFTDFNLGFSKTNFDSKAKEKGFHKLKKVDKGKYEKLY